MRPQRTPMKPPRKGCLRNPNAPTDPVEVCARIRNLTNKSDSGCIKIMNDTTLQLHSNEGRVTECQFYRLFNKHVGQKELFSHVAEPMVEDLVKGKSGLLFTYGVTSSGKTYTMTGTVDEPGFLPRSLDMIFNSISHLQASKYVFVPDGMNGFSVQSEADAMLDKQERDFLPQLTPRTPSKRQKHTEVRYDVDHCLSENVNPDCRYAVFVSYVEIYNDYIYDLLGDTQLDMFNRPKPPQSKRLREDRNKNMFVYGVSQVEVKTTQEAFAAFQQGQERRRIAHTQLNAESSRSHSIFNIRLVQAPLDPLGEDLLQERSLIGISQLSLVDLAGSERMGRTGAGGERLREAGNINSSLMTLRRCLEQLRENQRNGTCEMVKYRNSKLTHLFKNYFEGRGKVKMVVCLNPNSQEYEENMHVIQFAEVAQQVEVFRSEEYKVDRESIRKKAVEMKMRQEEERKKQQTAMRQLNSEATGHRLFKRSRSRQIATSSESESPLTDMETDYEGLEINLGNLGSSFPSLKVADAMDEETLPALIAFLESRISAVHSVKKTTESLGTLFRGNLLNQTSSDRDLQSRMKECQEELSNKTKDLVKIERQVKKLESKNQVLTRTTQVYEKDKKNLQDQLNDAEMQTKSLSMANRKIESKLRGAVENTKAQLERECEKRVRSVQTEMQEKMWVKDECLRQARNILVRTDGREGRTTTRQLTPSTSSSTSVSTTPHTRLKQRRSKSAENILSERKSLSKSRNKSTSDHDLRSNKTKKAAVVAEETECDEERNSQKDDGDRGVMTRSRRKRLYSNEGGDNNSLLDDQENERNLGCRYVNRRDELKFRRRPVIVAPKHRRSQSANTRNWLAHYPDSTVQPETILQPCIKPSRVVSVPSPKDVAGANKYILTHQHEDKDGEIETQLVKGEVFHTRTGGQQVQFVDIETLKQSDPQKKTSPNKKRKSATSMDELSSEEQSSWTDVETRCAFGVGVMNSAAKRKK